jgi:hypothetical protein
MFSMEKSLKCGITLGPGDASIAPAETEEDDFVSENGATFLLIYTE